MKIDGVRMLKAKPWLALSLVCVAGGLGVFAATASTRADQAPCGPPAAPTVAADSSARIYRVVIGHAFIGPLFATAGAPIQVWSFGAKKFHNVTRSYPRQIAADAAQWWATFQQHLNDGEGVIAAWAADEDLLGHYSWSAARSPHRPPRVTCTP